MNSDHLLKLKKNRTFEKQGKDGAQLYIIIIRIYIHKNSPHALMGIFSII
jgi:hypothetical protein